MCNCANIDIGSYRNQVNLQNWWNNEFISIDKCIHDEILFLWSKKIQTTGCCCGHNKINPMINVSPKYHNKMIKLGYKFWINKFGVKCYIAKSIKKS